GNEMPLNQVASVAAPEPKLLTIQPWDKSLLKAIVKAILTSDLGLTPSNDGAVVRIPIPALTEERRRDLVKVVHKFAEEGHVAILMDGNGRWARERNLPRPFGHRAGMKAVREVVEGAIEAGVEVLTLFAFSDENWQRPPTEISALMSLLEEYIAKEADELRQ